jgi:hypothetical protein
VVSESSGALSVPADAVAGELATAVGAAAGAVPGLAQAVADTSSSPASPAAIQSTAPMFRLRELSDGVLSDWVLLDWALPDVTLPAVTLCNSSPLRAVAPAIRGAA